MISRVRVIVIIAEIMLLVCTLEADDTRSLIIMGGQLSSNGKYLHVRGYDAYRVYDIDRQLCTYTLRIGFDESDVMYDRDSQIRLVGVSPSGDVHVTCRSGGNIEWFHTGYTTPYFVHRLTFDNIQSIEVLNDSLVVLLRSEQNGTDVIYTSSRGQIVKRMYVMHQDHIVIGRTMVAYDKNDTMYVEDTYGNSVRYAGYKPLKVVGDIGVIACDNDVGVLISVDLRKSVARLEARNVIGAYGDYYFVLDSSQGLVLKYRCRDNVLVDTTASRIRWAYVRENLLSVFTEDSISTHIHLEDSLKPERLFVHYDPETYRYCSDTVVDKSMISRDKQPHSRDREVHDVADLDTVRSIEHPIQDVVILSYSSHEEFGSWYGLLDGLEIRNTVNGVPSNLCRVEYRDDEWYVVFAARQHDGEIDSIRVSLEVLDPNYENNAYHQLSRPHFREMPADTYAIVMEPDSELYSDIQSRSHRRLSHDGQVETEFVNNSIVQRNVSTGAVYRELKVPSDIVDGEASFFVAQRTGQVVMSVYGHLWITTKLDTLRRSILQPVRIDTLHGHKYVDVYQSTGKKLTTLRVHRGVVVVRPSLLRQGASYLLPKNKSGRPVALQWHDVPNR